MKILTMIASILSFACLYSCAPSEKTPSAEPMQLNDDSPKMEGEFIGDAAFFVEFYEEGADPEADATKSGRVRYWFAGCMKRHDGGKWRGGLSRGKGNAITSARSHNSYWRGHGAKIYSTYRNQ